MVTTASPVALISPGYLGNSNVFVPRQTGTGWLMTCRTLSDVSEVSGCYSCRRTCWEQYADVPALLNGSCVYYYYCVSYINRTAEAVCSHDVVNTSSGVP